MSYIVKQIDDTLFKRLVHNEIHKKFSIQMSKQHLLKNFVVKSKKISSNDIANVILMPELDIQQLKIYLNTYNDEPDNLKKYAEYLAIISYNQVSPNRFQVKKRFEKLLEEQSSFWEDEYNCNITLNDIFIKRKFNISMLAA